MSQEQRFDVPFALALLAIGLLLMVAGHFVR
jgi:hypothetical protein